jgi:hypothetical protein
MIPEYEGEDLKGSRTEKGLLGVVLKCRSSMRGEVRECENLGLSRLQPAAGGQVVE